MFIASSAEITTIDTTMVSFPSHLISHISHLISHISCFLSRRNHRCIVSGQCHRGEEAYPRITIRELVPSLYSSFTVYSRPTAISIRSILHRLHDNR
jgi:hypothetical protein